MIPEYQETLAAHARMEILRLLGAQPAFEANCTILASALQGRGVNVAHDLVRDQIDWLAERQLVTARDVGGGPMPRKHTIKYLDSDTRKRIDDFLAAEGRSVDEFADFLRDEIGLDISRSSAHRYQQSFEKVAHRMRESREMAEAMCQELGPAAQQGRTGELIRELGQNLIFDHLIHRQETGETGNPKDLLAIMKSINELADAHKTDTDRSIAAIREEERKRGREEAQAEAAAQAQAVADRQGLSQDAAQAFIAEVFGDAA